MEAGKFARLCLGTGGLPTAKAAKAVKATGSKALPSGRRDLGVSNVKERLSDNGIT